MDIIPRTVFESKSAVDNRVMIVVSGNDPDAVWAAALDAKNGYGPERAPELRGLEASSVNGWWFCVLIEREPKSSQEE
jgi:hypothetical protein